MDKRMQHTK